MFKTKVIGVVILVISIAILTACNKESEEKIKPEYDVAVEDFNYTNQDGEKVSLEDLKGQYWVANLIFTNCETVCPPMTANMAKLQQKLVDEGIDNVRLVSFSVDPANDTPEKLKAFGNKFGANYSNWDFLTGYKQDKIEEFAANSFKALVTKVEGQDQVSHTTSFHLISPEGIMIHRFNGTSAEEMDRIVKYIKSYQN